MAFRSVDGLALTAVGAVLMGLVLPLAGQTGFLGIAAKIAVGALVLVQVYGLVGQVLIDRSVSRVSGKRDKTAESRTIHDSGHDS
jgi:hypothetical protein